MVRRPDRRVGKRRSGSNGSSQKPRSLALTSKERKAQILARLARAYPDAKTALHYKDPFQLLLAVILSAQCTDTRVNMITPGLFDAFPSPQAIAATTPRRLERYIKTCGLYRSKAKNIIAACKMLVERFGGGVPNSMTDLLALPGVGRKTANVILSVAYDQSAIAVDTHVFRVANRLGLVRAKTPAQAERQLMKVVPRDDWSHAHHWLIHHGRRICHARNPECARCPVVDLCPSAKRFLGARRLGSAEK